MLDEEYVDALLELVVRNEPIRDDLWHVLPAEIRKILDAEQFWSDLHQMGRSGCEQERVLPPEMLLPVICEITAGLGTNSAPSNSDRDID